MGFQGFCSRGLLSAVCACYSHHHSLCLMFPKTNNTPQYPLMPGWPANKCAIRISNRPTRRIIKLSSGEIIFEIDFRNIRPQRESIALSWIFHKRNLNPENGKIIPGPHLFDLNLEQWTALASQVGGGEQSPPVIYKRPGKSYSCLFRAKIRNSRMKQKESHFYLKSISLLIFSHISSFRRNIPSVKTLICTDNRSSKLC